MKKDITTLSDKRGHDFKIAFGRYINLMRGKLEKVQQQAVKNSKAKKK
jgi:hypothetical protein